MKYGIDKIDNNNEWEDELGSLLAEIQRTKERLKIVSAGFWDKIKREKEEAEHLKNASLAMQFRFMAADKLVDDIEAAIDGFINVLPGHSIHSPQDSPPPHKRDQGLDPVEFQDLPPQWSLNRNPWLA